MTSSTGQKVAVAASIVVYGVLQIVTAFGARRSNSWLFEKLYNNYTIGDVSRIYSLTITPAGYAFSIWGLIYLWQAVWLLYALSTVIRKSAPVVLPYSYHAGFIATIVIQFVWGIVWTRLQPVGSFVVLALDWIAVVATLVISYVVVQNNYPQLRKQYNKDLICLHVLVQNGLSILASWTTVATCINLAVMLVYTLSVSQTAAGCVALAALTVIALVYYVLENFIYATALRTTFMPWLVLIWALTASLVKNFNSSRPESIFTAVLLALTGVLLVIRIILLILRRKSTGGSSKSELRLV